MVDLDPRISEIANRSTVVTGCARSGTSLLGNLLHTCQDVEYCYEPPVVMALLAVLGTTPRDNWKLLFETALVRDFMVDRVAGRNLNTNINDESWFIKAKGLKESMYRESQALSYEEAIEICLTRTLVWKLPEAALYAQPLQKLYPSMRWVWMHRDGQATVDSLVKKGWFDDGQYGWLRGDCAPWWYPQVGNLWTQMEPEQRAYTYWRWTTEALRRHFRSGQVCIRYEDLCADPVATMERVQRVLKLGSGPKTAEMIQTVRK